MRRTLAYIVFASCVILLVIKTRASDPSNDVHRGSWAISKSDEPGKVEFALMEHRHDGNSNHQSDWPMSSFPGVDFSKAGRQDVRFTITVMHNNLNKDKNPYCSFVIKPKLRKLIDAGVVPKE